MPSQIAIDPAALAAFCEQHHVVKLAFFGSVLRDDFSPESDVDVLVEFAPGRTPGFFTLHEMEEELRVLLQGRPVDLLTFKGLNPRIRDRVIASAEVQFAA